MHPPPESLSMTHEASSRSVSRLWLRAFAGIVAVLSAPGFSRGATIGEIAATNIHPRAVFATKEPGSNRSPTSIFLTDAGIYELDGSAKSVRIWQRSDDGPELYRPKKERAAVPMDAADAKATGALRFFGKDADGNGVQFKQPVGMDREPGGTRFAVVNAGEWIERGNNRFCPSVQVYSLEEETNEDGYLSSAAIAFENEYKEAFYTVTNGAQVVMTGIVDTSYFTTNLLGIFYSTNWIHVISENPYLTITNDMESADALMLVDTNRWEEEVYHQQFTTNYEWRYTYTTNANYLSTATDVAFLGSSGIMVSMTADERRTMPSGFIVFDLADPSAKGALYPVDGLPGVIGKIAVDPRTGDVYASVPDAGAVYRFQSPGGSPGSWVSAIDKTSDIGVWLQDPVERAEGFLAGIEGVPSSLFGSLSNPADLSVWYSASLDEPVVLVADTQNGRIEAFDGSGTALFTFGTGGGIASDPLKQPKAVWGDPGKDVFAVSEGGNRIVRVFGPDLSGVDADEILSVFLDWPSLLVDLSVTNGLAFRDAIHTNTAESVSVVVVESDVATNVLRFAVSPSRVDRTYTISFSGADGVLEAVSASANVAAGETEGSFSFYAKDGIVNEDDGSIPVYKATVTAPSGASASATVAVLNANPVVTQPGLVGESFGTMFLATGFSVDAEDVDADADLSYFWFATTNFNWGVNNLLWAVTNRDAFVGVGRGWELLNEDTPAEMVVTNWVSYETANWTDYDGQKHYFETETRQASFFAEQRTTENGVVVNPIYLYVAQGKEVAAPPIFGGYLMEDVVSRMGGIVVLAVVDKDGGYAIVRFGKDYDSQDSEWTIAGGGGGGGGGESTAVYEVEFTDVSGTNVTFVVRRVAGESGQDDSVVLQTSTTLDGVTDPAASNWTRLKKYTIGTMSFPATFNLTPAGTGNVRFYRVVRP